MKEGVSPELIEDLKDIVQSHKVVLVHGGGAEVTELASRLGEAPKFVVSPEGIRSRYTDRNTAEIYTMVMAGRINKRLVMMLQAQGISSVGLSGLDGLLAQADRKKRLVIVDERGRKMIIDGGYTGTIRKVNAELLHMLMQGGYMPVVAPVALGEEFEPLNVDGDRMAARVAGAVGADKLILLTDTQGLMLDGKLVSKLTADEANRLLKKIGYGMITKIHVAVDAVGMGVSEVLIASGLVKSPISSSLRHEGCTVITNE